MKKFIKLCNVYALILSVAVSVFVITPTTVSATDTALSDWDFKEGSGVSGSMDEGYSLYLSSPARYNKPIDMQKGIMYKLSYSGEWVGFFMEGTRKESYGSLEALNDKLMYITRLNSASQKFSISFFNGTNEAGGTNIDIDTTGYVHICYKPNANKTYYYLYVNDKLVISAHCISAQDWATKFNNGMVYVSLTPWAGVANVTGFKPYSDPELDTDYSVTDGIIDVPANTYVSAMKSKTTAKSGEIRVFDTDGSLVEYGKLKTGMLLCDYININNKAEYTVSVSGDIECDGDINACDFIALRKTAMDTVELSGAVKRAADMNDNGYIDIIDLIKMKNTIIELETSENLFNVEDFGAVGDGVTDDTAAINAAITEAKYFSKKNNKNAQVCFENKSYAIKSQIQLLNVSNLTLKGDNTVIVGVPDSRYMLVQQSSDVKISGINFTYDTPVACLAKVVGRSSNLVMTFEVPEWYTRCIEQNEQVEQQRDNNSGYNRRFAIPANNMRNHSFISAIEKVDATHCKVTFIEISANGWLLMKTEDELKTAVDDRCANYVYLPTPGYSHSGTAFSLLANSGNVEIENCNVWNASEFVFQINNNSGNISFTNTNLIPKDSASCKTVAWRDCIHAKDNRGSLTFNDCNFGNTHDDIFNISNTMCKVLSVTNGTTLSLYGLDYGGNFVGINTGDTLIALNPVTDKYYGEATVTAVNRESGIVITINSDIGIEEGAYVCFKELANPGTTINGGNFSGSFRIRSYGAKITDADFTLVHMWTAYEGSDGAVEGPIPENITYKNCSFKAADGKSGTKMTFNCKLLDGSMATSYKVKNIVFDGCNFEFNNIIDRSKAGVIIK